MNRQKITDWHIRAAAALYTCLSSLLIASTAFAHDAPPGDEYQMADWMLFSFIIFFGVALIVFLFAWKRGLLSQPEDAKYYLLTINEQDYYTPGWALPDGEAPDKAPDKAPESDQPDPGPMDRDGKDGNHD